MSLKKINVFCNKIKYIKNLKIKTIIKIKPICYNYSVANIITILFNYSNSFLIVQNSNGSKKFVCSIKPILYKPKNMQEQILKYYYKILILKLKLAKTKVAIHFINATNYNTFLKNIAAKVFILILKFYKRYSFNGCRKKKFKTEKWLSGLRRQTVNLLVYTITGSNPVFSSKT